MGGPGRRSSRLVGPRDKVRIEPHAARYTVETNCRQRGQTVFADSVRYLVRHACLGSEPLLLQLALVTDVGRAVEV